MPEVSIVTEDIPSKADINIYGSSYQKSRVPWRNDSLAKISLESRLLISEERPQNNSSVDH